VVFIFATTEVHKIPATIMSRCQRYDFKLLTTAALTEHLGRILDAEKIAHEPEAIRLVAREAAGSVRDSLSLLDQVLAYVGSDTLTRQRVADVLGVADRRLLFQVAETVLARDVAAALRTVAAAVDRGLDLGQFSRAFLGYLHDLEIIALVPDAADLAYLIDASPEELSESKALVAKVNKGVLTTMFDRWARAVDESARSQTPRLVLEMALVDLCQAEPLLPLGDLLERLDRLEGRLASGAPAPARAAEPRRPAPRGEAMPAPRTVNAPSAAEVTASSPSAPAPSPSVPAPTPPSDVVELWRRVRESFGHRPALAAALDHAEVGTWESGTVTLLFTQKFALDQTAKAKAEVEKALSQIAGGPTHVDLQTATGKVISLVRSEVRREAEAAEEEHRRRETEAREHPMIKKAQEIFGVAPKEIKTR
jgi:DNA polymerase-3 subunit gamma/tau